MKRLLLSSALIVASAASAQAVTLINGSFESTPTPLPSTGTEIGFDYFSAIEGWTLASGPSIEVQNNDAIGLIDAQDGTNYVELASEGASTITQDVFLTAGRYELSFFYSPRSRDQNMQGRNNMAFGVVGVFSEDVLNAPSTDFPRGEWTEIAEVFNITSDGTYTLSFAGTGATSGERGAMIDNVSLAAVPLPAAGLLLLTALGGLASRRKR